MKRWLLLTLGLGLAALAGYSLLTLARERAPGAGAPPPSDHIDDASRDALREILRDAEADEAP